MLKRSGFFMIGNFGYSSNDLDGQTIKTREIHRLFVDNTGVEIPYFDTDRLNRRQLKSVSSLINILRAKALIYIPGLSNLKWVFPILYLFSNLFQIRIYYFVIGGWLPDFIQRHKLYKRMLSKIDLIFVETNRMLEKLNVNLDFKNVVWFPNFRIDHHAQRTIGNSEILRIVYLSRITIYKGVDTIFTFLDSFIKSSLYRNIVIDFYGPIDLDIRDWFFLQTSNHVNCNYRGIIAPNQVQAVLSNYDLLLFPTRYPGEGCPGVIIEAYMASVPVVASKWKYNCEFIEDGITGYLFDHNDIHQLERILTSLITNKEVTLEMGGNAKAFSRKFTSTYAWEIINKNAQLE